ncbi:MAG: HD domain-containing protein [Patulibacter minatonensis]
MSTPAGQTNLTLERENADRVLIAFETDRDGVLRRWSEGGHRVLGFAASELIGQSPPFAPPWPGHADWAVVAGAEDLVDATVVWTDREGGPHELAVSTTTFLDADGHPDGVLFSARDISQVSRDREQLAVYAKEMLDSYGRELHAFADLEQSYRNTVEALAVAVESKDSTTGGHIRRVSRLGALLAQAHLGDAARDPQLEYGFLLHDVGKLAVPDAVLSKAGALSSDEWRFIRQHPVEGARILAAVPFLAGAVDVVLHHHERWDGTGYPDGLAGEEIPIGARLFAIADTIDAMTSDRPYRSGLPLAAAIDEVVRLAGTQFDPACVGTLTRIEEDHLSALLEHHDA